MKTLLRIVPLIALLGATACGTTEDKTATMNDDKTVSAATTDKDAPPIENEEAVVRRTAKVDVLAVCFERGTAETWKELSLTTDQIRWMEQLQARMTARSENASASVNKDVNEPTVYTFSTDERRRLAEILTDDQLEHWLEMCPEHPAGTAPSDGSTGY